MPQNARVLEGKEVSHVLGDRRRRIEVSVKECMISVRDNDQEVIWMKLKDILITFHTLLECMGLKILYLIINNKQWLSSQGYQ